ncbi:COG4315 family predicted lipoprotein [Pseudonocardia sp. TRM90224]|uniref:COG4315 family predicted lipoprotein n=1 Tax=Pseudonocardia sp. TRM90224 TaxID=2812678 RepID=UPI001E50275B|nr:hypothetical protein [Pseudonocardia sp. TRM90224]
MRLLLLAALLVLAGCGGAADPPAPAPAAASADGGGGGHGGHGGNGVVLPALYAVQSGPLGVIATDGAGRLVYRSDADSSAPPTSNCAGPCAETWQPLTVEPGQEPELLGVAKAAVGTVQRADGSTQLTLAGWPLYRHRDDTGGLETAGHHGEGGTWWAVTPTGDKAKAPSQ